jgi:hypothetical protein
MVGHERFGGPNCLHVQVILIKAKVKVRPSLYLTKHQATKAYWESGSIAPLIL